MIRRINKKIKIRKLFLISFFILIILIFTNCNRTFYVPGASMGYFVWQMQDGIYHLRWSNDWNINIPNDNRCKFSGIISTNGTIIIKNLYQWEDSPEVEENVDSIKVESSKLEFIAFTTNHDYEDGIDFSVDKGTYIEFDLKINDGYDLRRISLGSFANNPKTEIFRLENNELLYEARKPFYLKHPFSTFFYKLSYDRLFTNSYFLLMGVILVEIIRVSILSKSKNYKKLTYISYALLFLILVIINVIFLRYS